MPTFVLIPGAGGAGEVYWREVCIALRAHGHTAIPVEIDESDPSLGLPEYAAITDDAIGAHRDVVLVAQSMGGFTAPMVGKIDQVARIVFVNAMIPLPGERPGQWWEATDQRAAFHANNQAAGRSDDFDVETIFLHDIPDDVKAGMADGDREPADTPFGQPCTFDAWPDIPLHVLVGADDRMFPADFQVRVAKERLGVDADVMPGGHLVAKSRPAEVAARLMAYADGTSGAAVPFGLDAAAAELGRIAANVRDDQLVAPTPCNDWTVGNLVEHICGLTKAFAHVARHETVPGAVPTGASLPDDWREQLRADLDSLVAAWRDPSAWGGEASAAGVTMPSAQWPAVVIDEIVLHGWDLARATGQDFTAEPDDVAICTGFAAAMSTPETAGSRQGLYGPLVETAPGADPLTALLGLAGRDPAWR